MAEKAKGIFVFCTCLRCGKKETMLFEDYEDNYGVSTTDLWEEKGKNWMHTYHLLSEGHDCKRT